MSKMDTVGRMEEQPSLNFNAYVKLTRLTKEDIEQNTAQNHKKENTNTSKFINQWNTPATTSIKQEYIENPNIDIYDKNIIYGLLEDLMEILKSAKDVQFENGHDLKNNINKNLQDAPDIILAFKNKKKSTVEHTLWQSSVEEFKVNVKIEATEEVVVKTEQENKIRNIIECTTVTDYVEIVNENEFICKICFANFNDFEECIVHKNLAHKIKPYICKICNMQFELRAHLNLHLGDHVDYLHMRNSSLSPSDIQSSSNVSINFTQNICVTDPNVEQKTKFKLFKCLNCVFTSRSETKFLNHRNNCSNISNRSSKFYQCNLCTRSFKTHSALNGHLKYHTFRSEITSRRQLALAKRKMKSQNKNSSVKSQKYVLPKIANFNRSFKCKDCNRRFTTRSQLNIHCKQHKQQMVCNMCQKKFVLKKNFEKHLLSHTNVTMSNDISNDTSFNESNLPHDQRAIKGSIKHKSDSETKIIKSTDDKTEVQKILKNEKSFQCFFCNNYFKSKQSLSQHNRQHHSRFKLSARKLKSKTVECKWCSLVITKCNLLRHIKSLHPEINPIKCQYCPVAFKDSFSLKLHTSRYHTV